MENSKSDVDVEKKESIHWTAYRISSEYPRLISELIYAFVNSLIDEDLPVYMVYDLPTDIIPDGIGKNITKPGWFGKLKIVGRVYRVEKNCEYISTIIEWSGDFESSLEIIVGFDNLPEKMTIGCYAIMMTRLALGFKGVYEKDQRSTETILDERISEWGIDCCFMELHGDGSFWEIVFTKSYSVINDKLLLLLKNKGILPANGD